MKKNISIILGVILILSAFNITLATDITSGEDTTYLYTNESGELVETNDYQYDEDATEIENIEDYYDLLYGNTTNQEELKANFEEQAIQLTNIQSTDANAEKLVITEILSDIKSEYIFDYSYYVYYLLKYQNVKVRNVDGYETSAVIILSYDISDNNNINPLKQGDTIYGYMQYVTSEDESYNIVNHGLTDSEIALVSITEHDRSLGTILLLVLTTLLLLLYAGKSGAKLLIPLFVAFDLIFIVLVPEIELGKNILIISTLMALELIILIATLKSGWSKKTLVSIISSIIVVALVTMLGAFFANTNTITGKGLISETNYSQATNAYYINQVIKTQVNTTSIYYAAIIIITAVVAATISSKITELSEKYAGTNNMINNIIEEGKQIIKEYPMIIAIIYMVMAIPKYMTLTFDHISLAQLINSEQLITDLSLLLITIISSVIILPITAIISNILMGNVEIKQIEN